MKHTKACTQHAANGVGYVIPSIIFLWVLLLFACNGKKNHDALTAVPQTDAQFIIDAAAGNWTEIQFAQLAQNNAVATEVKSLGRIMEEKHAAFLTGLQELATKKHIELPPTTLSDSALETYKVFFRKTGADFDTAYCELVVNSYREAINRFEKATSTATDYDTRYWARSMLPLLQTNLDYAVTCQKKFSKISKMDTFNNDQPVENSLPVP
jgi:predicted outer membrane protein